MKLKAVKDADKEILGSESKYWKGEHWVLLMGPQFSKELEGQLVVAVTEHAGWHTVYPYFRLAERIKHLAEPLALFLMKKLSPISDVPESRKVIEGLMSGLGHCFGELKDDWHKNCGDQATYCQVDPGKIHESLELEIAKKNGK